jgi:hypothetical protein
MTNTKTITTTTVEPTAAAALWRIVLSAYESEVAAYAVSAAEYSAAGKAHEASGLPFAAFRPAEEKHDKAADALANAREALFLTPAPDADALLLKLDILMEYLADCDAEDVKRVGAVRDDARRLFEAA